MTVVQTSMINFAIFRAKLTGMKHDLYWVIRNNPDFTDKELQQLLGWEINQITGRRNDLVKLDLIYSDHQRKCTITNNIVRTWRAF